MYGQLLLVRETQEDAFLVAAETLRGQTHLPRDLRASAGRARAGVFGQEGSEVHGAGLLEPSGGALARGGLPGGAGGRGPRRRGLRRGPGGVRRRGGSAPRWRSIARSGLTSSLP
eukprot:SRR837773.23830.p2 GENE.SRR837773.23830~~SRR837773.23830.p2  ORF type:complete len:127 (-),score=10.81 SRR837773.23830:55-399(-)